MNIKQYLWIIPFLSFTLGYSITQWYFHVQSIITPLLVGKYVHDALPIISQNNLNLRLIDQKQEANIPEGIILTQSPAAGKAIKPNQNIFIVTTKKPSVKKSPECIGKDINLLIIQLKESGIDPRIYHISHQYPAGICFAQSPEQNEPLDKNRITLYISSGNNKPIIWPNFIGQPLEKIITLLDVYNIKPYILNDTMPSQKNEKCMIIDQRPLAGTLLTLDDKKPLSVQLRI